MRLFTYYFTVLGLIFFTPASLKAQNPLITNQFTADPSARVFNGRVYVYPSHDIPVQPGKGRPGWFCMEDYHVFSSANLTDWKDHGKILSQTQVPWADPAGYSMWAPDCVFKNGKYYFYFPATLKPDNGKKSFAIGVAIADHPAGPFRAEAMPIAGVHGIDPNVYIDKNGEAYLYWSQGDIYGARLKPNMVELATEPQVLGNLPDKGLEEGPYLFERQGTYYLTYPHVANKIERLEYATAKTPLGPFTVQGVIMDESPQGCWTNHHSIIFYQNQWLLFYHHNDLSPGFDKNRSIRADSLFFNADGSIVKVKPTLRGVGVTPASAKVQIDRYSDLSKQGAEVNFIDTANRFEGWKVQLREPGSWVRYNRVDFGAKKYRLLLVKAISAPGTTIAVYSGKPGGKLLAKLQFKGNKDWRTLSAPLSAMPKGIEDLFIVMEGNGNIDVDWLTFKQ